MKARRACTKELKGYSKGVTQKVMREKSTSLNNLPRMACLEVHSKCGHDLVCVVQFHCRWMGLLPGPEISIKYQVVFQEETAKMC